VARFREDVTELWDYTGTEVHRTLERGDEVLLVVTNHMRGKGSGVEFAEPVAQRYRLRDGRVVAMTLLTDVEAAVAEFEGGGPPASV
jgi:ketosteroid isomerase-like protein